MPVSKKRRQGRPNRAFYVTTYAKLVSYLQSFAQGRFHLVILIGSAGLAKSRTARRVLGADV
jgi:hypothetical protein